MPPATTTFPDTVGPAPAGPLAATGRPAATAARPPDLAPVEEVFQLLARAIRQFHTYPATSPLCIDAVMACLEALTSIEHRDRLTARITPQALIVDEFHLGAGTVIEHELTRRLYKLRVATLEIDRAATSRDLTRFCLDLVQSEEVDRAKLTFSERLTEHGVESIIAGMAHRPAVLDVGAPSAHVRDLVEHERRRQLEVLQPDAPVSYLYPPDKGWVRIDPAQSLDAVSLLDLVVLVDDPADVATMLLTLTDDDATGPDARQAALERKFSDVTTLFSALDPRLAHVMFGKLARAVLNLEPDRRKHLLQRTILPGLLDGRADGTVLRDFPDMDLAESLCLLLDLETAAPEVLSAALNRLDLTPDRRDALVPLIDKRLRDQHSGKDQESGIERYARELIRVKQEPGKDFSEFAAFDLSLDASAETAVTAVRDGIWATDVVLAQLRCIAQLVRLEPNPTLVEAFLSRGNTLFDALERAGRWSDLISAITDSAQLADELKEARPDVADTVSRALGSFWSQGRLAALADLHERDEDGRARVRELASTLGTVLVPGFVALLNDASQQTKARALTPLMCELAPALAPALEVELGSCAVQAARVIVKILGYAGTGRETAVARLVGHHDAQVAREALRALARIGSPAAATLVTRHIEEGSQDRRAAAEEALWHFPPAQTSAQLRHLLRSRDFVMHHPQTVTRLLDRAAQTKATGLDDVLGELESLRFRFWKPSLVRVALKARGLRSR